MNDIIKFEKIKDNAAPTEVVYVTINDFFRIRECDMALSIGELVKRYLIL